MNQEEMKIPADLNEAYQMAQSEGFTGSMEEFEALCARAAEDLSRREQLNLDDMDAVAGGNAPQRNVNVDFQSNSGVGQWMSEHPAWAWTITALTIVATGALAYYVSDFDPQNPQA